MTSLEKCLEVGLFLGRGFLGHCLLGSGSLEATEDTSELGAFKFFGVSFNTIAPVVLGLSHAMTKRRRLEPAATFLGSALLVELGKVFEHTSLLDVARVVVLLFLLFLSTKLFVLRFSQAIGDVGLAGDATNLQILLGSSTIVVLILDRFEEIKAEDLVR